MKARVPVPLSHEQKKEIRSELKKQVIEFEDKYSKEVDAITLWTLHIFAGWGKDKLHKFWDEVFDEHQRLKERYELDDEWIYQEKLRRMGVDIDEWYKEKDK